MTRIDRVITQVAAAYDSSETELRGQCRKRTIIIPRHMAFAILHSIGYSYPQIGAAFQGRDHATVMHGVKRAKDHWPTVDPTFSGTMARILENVSKQPAVQFKSERAA